MKRTFFLFLKLGFTASLLGYLLASVELSALQDIFRRINLYYYAAALAVGIAAVVISAYKWQVLLAAGHVDCTLGLVVRYYLIGIYFNNFLPTSFGGDAARIYLVSRGHGNSMFVAVSVLVERVSGLLALISFMLLGLIVGPRILGPNAVSMVVSATGFTFLGAILFLHPSVKERLQQLLPETIGNKLALLFRAVAHDLNDRRTAWRVAWTSLIFQWLSILIYVLVGHALALQLSFFDLLAVVPLVTLLTMLPISFNGLGLREGGFVYLLSGLHVVKAEALALSLLFYSIPVFLSVAGGVLFLFPNLGRGGRSETEA